jgi:hypothetical protein
MKLTLVFSLFLILGFLFTTPMLRGQEAQTSKAAYVCPMHPTEVSDKPGKCPKCGMDLVKNVQADAGNKPGGTMQMVSAPSGRPTHHSRVEKYDIRCWVMPKSECTAACGMEMKKEAGEKEGTHCVMVSVRSRKTKKPVNGAEVWFHIVYPGKRNLMPKLRNMGEVFGGEIDLSEKGRYTMMAHVTDGDKHPATKFKYRIK